MADNQYGYSTGYPGFAGQPANQGSNQFMNYPQWNSSGPYTQPPPSGPPQGGYQTYSQPPPSFPQGQPSLPGNFSGGNQYGSKDGGNHYSRSIGNRNGGSGGGDYGNRGTGYDSGSERNSGGRSGGGNYNSGANRSGYNKAGPVDTRTGDLVVQQDTIFISGMNPQTSETQIVSHFGAIGVIKIDKKTNKPKIWMYTDKATGRPKGEATVTFEDPFTASSAIEWFDGKEFNGSVIAVQLASRRDNWQGGRGGGGSGGGRGSGGRGSGRGRGGGGPRDDDRGGYDDGRGGYLRGDDDGGFRDRGGPDYRGGGGFRGSRGGDRSGGGFKGGDRDSRGGGGRGDRSGGGGGYGGREGDWKCPNPECGNTNFSWRQQCNRCNEDKPMDGGPGGGESDRRGGGRGGRGGFGGGGRGRGDTRGSGSGRGGGGRGGGPMRNDYGNNRNRPY